MFLNRVIEVSKNNNIKLIENVEGKTSHFKVIIIRTHNLNERLEKIQNILFNIIDNDRKSTKITDYI